MLDSHTHLNSWILFPDWQKHISDFEKEWWNRLVNAWSDWEYNENGITICKGYKWKSYVKCTLGLHPLEVVEWKVTNENINEELMRLENMYVENKEHVVAIWEIWIDVHYDWETNLELQKQLFDRQMKLARKYNLPVVIHSRDDFNSTYEILEIYKDLKIYIHCRWYWSQQIAKVQNNFPNLWIWFCGNTTYPSAQNLRDSLKMVDLDRLLIETDAPYLPVKQFRGQINTPAMITYLYDFISDFLWIERSELEEKVEKNFDRLYIN